MVNNTILLTGCTGNVGNYVTLFLCRFGIADSLYLLSSNKEKISNILNNARLVSLMHGSDLKIEGFECNILNYEMTAEYLKKINPTLIINCSALFSLYPFLPALKKRQKRMNFIPGFGHTLPKDLALLWPLMKAVKEACPDAIVVNIVAPDTGNAILNEVGLSPTIGAGTIDSTVHGIRLGVSKRLNTNPHLIDVKMVCHHALRRFSPDDVPFFIRIFYNGKDITEELNEKELIIEAVDVSGVETVSTPVASNAPITAASAIETAKAILSEKVSIRHAAGIHGNIGGYPVKLGYGKAELILPEGISYEEAIQINNQGMKMDGVEKIDLDGSVIFTEREHYWLQEGLGLRWKKMKLEDALPMAEELRSAYQRLYKEEMS